MMCIYAAVKIAMTSCCHSNNDIIVLLTLDELDDSVVQCSHGNQSVQKIIRNDTHSRRSSIAAVHCRRPCLSRGRGASVEQSSLPMFKRHLKTVLFAKSYWTLAVSDDLNTFHRTFFYLRLILFGVLAVVLTLCHLNHIRLLTIGVYFLNCSQHFANFKP